MPPNVSELLHTQSRYLSSVTLQPQPAGDDLARNFGKRRPSAYACACGLFAIAVGGVHAELDHDHAARLVDLDARRSAARSCRQSPARGPSRAAWLRSSMPGSGRVAPASAASRRSASLSPPRRLSVRTSRAPSRVAPDVQRQRRSTAAAPAALAAGANAGQRAARRGGQVRFRPPVSRPVQASTHGPSPRLTCSSSIRALTSSVAKTKPRSPELATTLTPAPDTDRWSTQPRHSCSIACWSSPTSLT